MKFSPISRPILGSIIITILSLSWALASGTMEDTARGLLLKALENQYRGHYQANLELVNEIFPNGSDSLRGQVEFSDEVGERRICLAGAKQAFEYHSLHFGKEQWVIDDQSHRIRRIANRQWKKGMFGTLFSYEDILKFPNDFFLEYSSCQGLKATDSTYQIEMTVKPLYQSFYSKLDITLSKEPVLLKSISFYGHQEQKLKTMDVKAYQQISGKWLISDLTVSASDSLSRLAMCFRNFNFPSAPLVKDGLLKPESPIFLSKLVPKIIGGASENGAGKSGSESGLIEDISN